MAYEVKPKHKRKRKTGLSGEEWRQIFGQTSKKCWEMAGEGEDRVKRFRECMSAELGRYKKA